MKILFLTPYPTKQAPSQRFRFEQYFPHLLQEGHQYTLSSFLNSQNWQVFYNSGKIRTKVFVLLLGFSKRILDLVRAIPFDFVFVHREASPLGPPIFEWLLAKVFRKKIIFDFDDAIWLTDKTNEAVIERMLRWRSKVGTICRLSYKVSCGNEYLAEYARQFNKNVIVNPTTIDTEIIHKEKTSRQNGLRKEEGTIIIGWTGSHSTLKYLEGIETVLQTIEKRYTHVSFLVIANRKPDLNLSRLRFIRWRESTEVQDLLTLDIGLMPLSDDEWTRGKCGFKALQYMALGVPPVSSPVGVNLRIIQDGVNGYLVQSHDEWVSALSKLIEDATQRKIIGENAMKKIEQAYSVRSNRENFLNLFS